MKAAEQKKAAKEAYEEDESADDEEESAADEANDEAETAEEGVAEEESDEDSERGDQGSGDSVSSRKRSASQSSEELHFVPALKKHRKSWESLDVYLKTYEERTKTVLVTSETLNVRLRNERLKKQKRYLNMPDSEIPLVPKDMDQRLYICTHGWKPRKPSTGLRPQELVRKRGNVGPGVSHELTHFRNNTNNRLESFFGKLKADLDGSFSMKDCLQAIINFQRRKEDDYHARVMMPGSTRNANYGEEMNQFLGMLSDWLADILFAEYQFATDPATMLLWLRTSALDEEIATIEVPIIASTCRDDVKMKKQMTERDKYTHAQEVFSRITTELTYFPDAKFQTAIRNVEEWWSNLRTAEPLEPSSAPIGSLSLMGFPFNIIIWMT
ncbi:unnamed protein product [Phytophthora fragariaefolia]|uniref:Unnamed protein product n=1 Tax=Phytophthora fragariaefolia TaxID=1490495 RepID=A0A9W6Y8G1_9STRA|nr:unnamed protein product [Phytophthora fragariaefolia]